MNTKKIITGLCVVAVFALAAMAAQAQNCSTPEATLTSPANGSTLVPDGAGNITWNWCNASADYFVTIETVPGAHDIFFAFTGGAGGGAGQNFLTFPAVPSLPSPLCSPVPPIGCIPELGEHIYFTLDTVKNKTIIGTHSYGFTAPGPGASFSPTSLNLGTVLVGASSAAKKVTFTNNGTTSFTISGVTASGNFSQTNTCSGVTLAPLASCDISATFSPSVTGTIPGALTVSDNSLKSPHVVALTGKGVGPITLMPASLIFGTVAKGATSTKTLTLTNNTSGSLGFTFLASLNYNAVGSGTKPCTGTLTSKATCTMSITFTPTANGAASGSLAVSSASFPTQLAGLSGIGSGFATSPLTFSPTALSFSSTLIGTASALKTVTVTNSSASAVNITNFVASGDFSVVGSGTPCGGVLGAGLSCNVAVAFHPSIPGMMKGSVTFMDNAAVNTQLYNLTGKAVLPVTFNPTSLTFTAQNVGTTSLSKSLKLTNNQAVALTLTSLAASGQYTVAPGTCLTTVSAHGSCTFTVTFSPKQTGTIPGVITVKHNASGNPQAIKLTGTGQ
jgi:ASPM-SPD-2-Hydin domain-containing protein/HYDIN/CFA65/VesB family protein/centrosomal CEP192-like protein